MAKKDNFLDSDLGNINAFQKDIDKYEMRTGDTSQETLDSQAMEAESEAAEPEATPPVEEEVINEDEAAPVVDEPAVEEEVAVEEDKPAEKGATTDEEAMAELTKILDKIGPMGQKASDVVEQSQVAGETLDQAQSKVEQIVGIKESPEYQKIMDDFYKAQEELSDLRSENELMKREKKSLEKNMGKLNDQLLDKDMSERKSKILMEGIEKDPTLKEVIVFSQRADAETDEAKAQEFKNKAIESAYTFLESLTGQDIKSIVDAQSTPSIDETGEISPGMGEPKITGPSEKDGLDEALNSIGLI